MRPESQQGSVEQESVAILAPSTIDVVGVPLGLIDYERTLDWIDATVAARQTGLRLRLQRPHGDGLGRGRGAALGAARLVDQRARRPAAGVGAGRAGPSARRPRLRPELMARACAAAPPSGPAAVSLRRTQPGGAGPAGAEPAPALSRREDRRRLLAAAPSADRRGARRRGQGDQRLAGRRGVGRDRRAQAGEVDGRDAPRLDAPVLIGVGAAFDFHAGLVPQAPTWIQESGLEWAYRLAHEPRRLCAALHPLQPPLRARLRAPVAGTPARGRAPAGDDAVEPRAGPRCAATARRAAPR